MEKCDLCVDRLSKGEKPICVGACQTRALDVDPLDELQTKYGKTVQATGFNYHVIVRPSVIHKQKQQ
jgi:anaerobic dimethyl sulfoxide reductase subunit B (iron-sulfur subunit)